MGVRCALTDENTMIQQEISGGVQPEFIYSMNCKGRQLNLDSPVIMGILNITPDSFFDGGKFTEETAIRTRVGEMVSQGATIIDIGAASSRPGAEIIAQEEELKRLIPAVELVANEFPEIFISVDTYRAGVAKEAILVGAHIINDISAGDLDPEMFKTVSELGVPYLMMHMQGTPLTMQKDPVYGNVVIEVMDYFAHKVKKLRTLGVNDIIVDPGFGFGKTVDHNFSLLAGLDQFSIFGCPILVGLSRKSMINKVLKISAKDALNGTTSLNTIALMKGAQILRVHDVKEAKEVIDLYEAYLKGNELI
ncbi:dihydropteroate synthase [soil metagenome]